jgi:co-chaperonin GroES (HSP10)
MLKIVGHRVLVKPAAVEEVDASMAAARRMGLVIPDSDNEALRKNAVDRGVVVDLGQTAYLDFGGTPWVSVGDSVYFSKYAGKHLTDPYTEEKFVALNDEDIIAIIKQETKQ